MLVLLAIIIMYVCAYVCAHTVSGLVDYEAIPGMSSSKPTGSRSLGHTSNCSASVVDVVKQLSNFAECFTRNSLDLMLTRQIFRQVLVSVSV